jgi:hypothetical protein
MSVIVSFFEEDMIKNRKESYLTYLRAGGAPQNAMMAFALCTDLDLPRALRIPPPLPRTVDILCCLCTKLAFISHQNRE